jgi:hypothetical protein
VGTFPGVPGFHSAERILLMWRISVLLLVFGLLAGCRAPMPSVNTFSPYTTTRVAPPSTGSYGAPTQDQYYPGANQTAPGNLPGVSVGVRPMSATMPLGENPQPVGSQLQWQQSLDAPAALPTSNEAPPANSGGAAGVQYGVVAPTALTAESIRASAASSESAIRIVEQPASAESSSTGRVADDAMQEPGRFEPDGNLIEISKLTPAPAPPHSVGSSPPPANLRATAPANVPAQPPAGPAAGDSVLRWQNKVG